MTKTDVPQFPSPPLTDDRELQDFLGDLLRSALRRRVWLFFLDEEGRLTETIMPSDDLPDDPAEVVEADDLGPVTYAQVLAQRLPAIAELIGAAQSVLVWEHPGPGAHAPEAVTWPRAIAAACLDAGVPLRAQFVLHDTGIRQVTIADF